MRIADFFLLPNLCSISRIFLTPILACFLASSDPYAVWWAVTVLVIAALTDWLDGYLARRSGEITPLGIALDPVADKIFAAITIILLIFYREFPIWLAAAIIGRDLLIIGAGFLLIQGQKIVLPSNLTGKYTFASIAVLIGCYLIRFPFGETFMSWIVVVMLAASLINYTRIALLIRQGKTVVPYHDTTSKRWLRLGLLFLIIALFGFEFWRFYFLNK